MRNLNGIIIPAVTPFDENGELNLDMLKFNFNIWNKTDVSGYMCLGSNGEFRMLSDDESFSVIHSAASCADPKKCLIAGVGRESLYQTLRFIDRIASAGLPVDYFSVLTPHYFKKLISDEALIEYFTEIANFSPVPILLYCAPAFANDVTISEHTVRALMDHPNIHGIKDTSANMMSTYTNAASGRSDFTVMSGSMSTILTCMDQGGHGAVVSASNYFPQECSEIIRLYHEEGRERSLEYYNALNGIIKKTGARASVAGVKCCMNLLGYKGGMPRKPILPVSKQVEEEMKKVLTEAGYIK